MWLISFSISAYVTSLKQKNDMRNAFVNSIFDNQN